jgi:hypothetical protein
MRAVSGLPGRIVEALHSGNVELIQTLFDAAFLEPTDTLDLTGCNRHESCDAVSMLHVLSRRPCPDYKYMIDTLLFNGVSIDDGMPCTPLEEAIQAKNFPTAVYLESKGATYSSEEVAGFLNDYEVYKASRPC